MVHRKIVFKLEEVIANVDAFTLADKFVEYMRTGWDTDPSPGPLSEFFASWAEEADLFRDTEDHALALQAQIVAWVRFAQRPEDFGQCAEVITGLANISIENRELDALIDPDTWRTQLFLRKHGSR